jgi:hypothetical protein
MSEPLNEQAKDMDTLSNLYKLQSILTNMNTNIILIEEGATGQSITVNNANLYQLASQFYGNANLWTTIAEANGLVDPYVTGGSVMAVSIVDPGENYTNPQVIFAGDADQQATGFCIVSNGQIVGVTITNNGSRYMSQPDVLIVDETGANFKGLAICYSTIIIPVVTTTDTGGVLNI